MTVNYVLNPLWTHELPQGLKTVESTAENRNLPNLPNSSSNKSTKSGPLTTETTTDDENSDIFISNCGKKIDITDDHNGKERHTDRRIET